MLYKRPSQIYKFSDAELEAPVVDPNSIDIESNTSSLKKTLPVNLFFHDIKHHKYTSDMSSQPEHAIIAGPLQILNGISGLVQPGSMLAILGPSGSGKTTLLDVLSGRTSHEGLSTESQILINGKPRNKKFSRIAGYVMQDDALLGSLTVRETLLCTAMLRLPRSMKMVEKEKRVDEVISQLKLDHIAHNLIGGSFIRGISGGERKRVAIGVELVTAPSLLFVDEPTSGLDAASSLSVIETLLDLTKSKHTIVCTIHQPRSSIFKVFDQVMVLSRGDVIYYGKALTAIDYFSELGYQCDSFTNPADFLLDLIQQGEANKSNNDNNKTQPVSTMMPSVDLDKLAAAYKSSKNYSDFEQSASNIHFEGHDDVDVNSFAVSKWYQFWVLLYREIINSRRNPAIFWIRLGHSTLMALLVGSVFWQAGNDDAGIQKRTSALFFMCCYLTLSSFPALGLFIEERLRFNRERFLGTYHTVPYFFAVSAAQVPILFVVGVVFTSIAYWMVGFQASGSAFVVQILFLLLISMVGDSMCLWISSVSKSNNAATASASAMFAFYLLFGGFFVKRADTPIYWRWAHYLSFFKYSFEGTVINELEGQQFCIINEVNITSQCVTVDGHSVLQVMGMTETLSLGEDFVLLLSFFVLFRILILLSLLYLNKERR